MNPLATRRYQLIQVGIGKAPRLDAQTELSYTARLTQTETEGGGTFDHYATRYAPLNWGKFKHSGLYPRCLDPISGIRDYTYLREEIDYIQNAKAIWTPMLFYADSWTPQYTVTKDNYNNGTPLVDPDNCGVFLWAYGKITSSTNVFSYQDYLQPRASAADIEGVLRTPLTPITWARWRWGVRLVPSSTNMLIMPDLELANAEASGLWYSPCGAPTLDEPERFWPRNMYSESLDSGAIQFDPTKWDAQYQQYSNVTSDFFPIGGNAQPRTRCLMSGNASLSIRNALGTFVYSFNRPLTSVLYTDSWTGVVMEKRQDGVILPAASAGPPPELGFGENAITCNTMGGFVTLGYTESWIN